MTDINQHTWHWQPYGTPWKGVAIYHVSFSVGHSLADRRVLGELRYPELGTLGERRQNGREEWAFLIKNAPKPAKNFEIWHK